jgi:hypothetical protein
VETGCLGEEGHCSRGVAGGEGGGEAEGWGRDAPKSRESCFFGSGFASWVCAQVKSTWGPGLLSISKQASLAFFLAPVRNRPFLALRTTLARTIIALRACHHPSPNTQHPTPNTHHPSPSTLHPAAFAQHPWSKQHLNSPPCAALLHPTPHRTAPHHSLPSTPLHSIRTQGPSTPIEESQHLGRSIIGESIINCPRPPSSPLPPDSLLSRTVAVAHPAGICIIRF